MSSLLERDYITERNLLANIDGQEARLRALERRIFSSSLSHEQFPVIDFRDFSPDRTGVDDVSGSLQAAIEQAAVYNTNIYVPYGVYLLNTGVTWQENTGLIGDGRCIGTQLGTWFIYSGSGNAFTIDGQWTGFDSRRNIIFQDFAVICTNATSSYGIKADFLTLFTFNRLYISGAKSFGIHMQNSYNGVMDQVRIRTCAVGMRVEVKDDASDNVFSGQMDLRRLEIWECTGDGLQIAAARNTLANLNVYGGHFKENGACGVDVEAVSSVCNVVQPLFVGCHFEANTTAGIRTAAEMSKGPHLLSCYFNHTAGWGIIDNATGTILDNPILRTSGTPTGGIDLNGSYTRLVAPSITNFPNSVVLESTLDNAYIGKGDISSETGNKITDNGATHVTWEGLVESISLDLDLSAAAKTHMAFIAKTDLWLLDSRLVFTEASSADAGVVVGLGISTNATKLFSYTTAASQAIWTIVSPTISTSFIAAGEIVVFRNAGGKTGAGEVKIQARFVPFSMA